MSDEESLKYTSFYALENTSISRKQVYTMV